MPIVREERERAVSDERPTWSRWWLFGLAILVLGVIIALGSLSDDDGASSAAETSTAALESTTPSDEGDSDDGDASGQGPASGDEDDAAASASEVDEPACRFADRMTTLILDGALVNELTAAGIELSVIVPATGSVAEGVQFPVITSRVVTCEDYGAVIGHRGGLRMELGRARVELRRLRITRATGAVGAFADSATESGVDAFRVDLDAAVEPVLDGVITLRRVPLTLTAEGAATLNAGLGTAAFRAGAPVGLMDIR